MKFVLLLALLGLADCAKSGMVEWTSHLCASWSEGQAAVIAVARDCR